MTSGTCGCPRTRSRGVHNPILEEPREYAYVPGHYAVLFSDPDAIKLELMHVQG